MNQFFKQSVAYISSDGIDGYGRETYGTVSYCKARLERKNRFTQDEDGRDTKTDMKAFIPKTESVIIDDLFLTTDEVFRVKQVYDVRSGNGNIHHYEIDLEKTTTDETLPSGYGGA